MESFVHEYISSAFEEDLNEGQLELERRLSPYATLRAGDLAALLRLHSPLPLLPFVNTRFSCSHGNDNNLNCENRPSHEVDVILERKEDILCAVEQDETVEIVCRGVETNNSPVEYSVKGLHHHEMPVIGICVDNRICPGFQYRVRRVGSDRFFYNNAPKTLLSIGMGYGKRLTFSGDSLNHNDCYFWSDSEPNGYAFSIHAVDIGQRFSIMDSDNVIVGEAVIDGIEGPQEEMDSVIKDRVITKRVRITTTCSMRYYQRHNHGLVELMAHEDSETITGEAVLTKCKANKTACLASIEQVFLQRFGLCHLEPDV